MAVEFSKTMQTASFYSPLEDFDRVEVDVEVRRDPLTNRQSRVVSNSFVMPQAEPDIEGFVSDAEGCFFCPEMVLETTPEYPEWVGVDRGEIGEATSFPNLNPYGAYSNVVALTEDHYRPIGEFTPSIFADGFAAALEYITAVLQHDSAASVASINMNFLRSAGSSLVHPHIQTLVDSSGTNEQARLFDSLADYRERTGGSYWADLFAEDAINSRLIAAEEMITWFAPFAPIHHRHIRGVAEYTGVPGGNETVVQEIASGITNSLAYYGDVGLNSFNFAVKLGEGRRPVIDVVARSVFDDYYWSDATFFTVLHDEPVIDVAPEEYAEQAQTHF